MFALEKAMSADKSETAEVLGRILKVFRGRLSPAEFSSIETELIAAHEKIARIRLAANKVVWYDWSGNDADAVLAVEDLRRALKE